MYLRCGDELSAPVESYDLQWEQTVNAKQPLQFLEEEGTVSRSAGRGKSTVSGVLLQGRPVDALLSSSVKTVKQSLREVFMCDAF